MFKTTTQNVKLYQIVQLIDAFILCSYFTTYRICLVGTATCWYLLYDNGHTILYNENTSMGHDVFRVFLCFSAFEFILSVGLFFFFFGRVALFNWFNKCIFIGLYRILIINAIIYTNLLILFNVFLFHFFTISSVHYCPLLHTTLIQNDIMPNALIIADRLVRLQS